MQTKFQLAAYCLQCAELSKSETLRRAWRALAQAYFTEALGDIGP